MSNNQSNDETAKYLDSIDPEEFKLFRKYNNNYERKSRHIDAFLLDDPALSSDERQMKVKSNIQNLRNDMVQQMKAMPDYFSEENECLRDDVLAKPIRTGGDE